MNKRVFLMLFIGILSLLFGGLLAIAQDNDVESVVSGSPLHPTFALLDNGGENVLDTGNPVSAMNTCGSCHDTAFIVSHSIHNNGSLTFEASQLVWDNDTPTSEMNCFLCHLDAPNNEARLATLDAGYADWATTATLSNMSFVTGAGDEWAFDASGFNEDGTLEDEYVTLSEPSDTNCAQCHGVTHENAQIPMAFDVFDTSQWVTTTTGQVFSPQRISSTGMNIADKNETTRTWDVHSERVVNCVDCHYSLNNPVFYQEGDESRPEHLVFDPRRMEFGDYLTRPLHEFANSSVGEQSALADMGRTCSDCHESTTTHDWLPYSEGHMNKLACETCHIPELSAGALEFADYTVLNTDGDGVLGYRGLDLTSNVPLLTGYEPVLLVNENDLLAPYNLISVWYWIDSNGNPIPQETITKAYFEGDAYTADVLRAFDSDNDNALSDTELLIDTDEKQNIITERLADAGYPDATIAGEVQSYPIHHSVTHGEWATRECATCHSDDSRLYAGLPLSNRIPNGVIPAYTGDNLNGTINLTDNGLALVLLSPDDLYIFGHDNVLWIDWVGIGLFLATMLGVLGHGGIRYMMARRIETHAEPDLREVYMYSRYERQWHWLQSAAIFGLIFTGLVIHKPDMFGMFSFRYNVLIHNALALILVINAALAAFYHLATGEIRQYIPEPRGFFGKMFAQAKYYLWGIFRNDHHPFEKLPDSKLNPIQQLTYFGLLNVLLPLQVITGTLMWGAQRFPTWTERLGGLPFLAPFHSLIAWLLATFIVLHVYMTTTGHTPLANIKAMIGGWDEVETHSQDSEFVQQGGD